jgi:hypothetical protein
MSDSTVKILDCKPILRLWNLIDGDFFCVSSKPNNGNGWRDEWFTRRQLCEVHGYVNDIAKNHHVYFSPLAFNTRRRKKVTAVPAPLLFADLDSEYDRDRLREWWPSLLWLTSPGKRSAVWVTDEVQQDDHLNHRLTDYLNADRGGWDWSQVLRWPGSINWKYPDAPRGCLAVCDLQRELCTAELDSLLPQVAKGASGQCEAPPVYPDKHDWHEVLTHYGLRKLNTHMGSCVGQQKRSQVYWRIACDLVEAGATRDEVACVVWASGAFQSKHGNNLSMLAYEINNAFVKKAGV